MSVHIIPRRKNGPAYDVRWRSNDGQWSRRFDDPQDAEAFDTAMKARLDLDRAQEAYGAVPERWKATVDAELAELAAM
jgi:hypothetical protein